MGCILEILPKLFLRENVYIRVEMGKEWKFCVSEYIYYKDNRMNKLQKLNYGFCQFLIFRSL
jgi:hypothetical protein